MKTINKKLLLEAFKKIILIRRVEEKISEEFKSNKIFSFLHLSIGQEATAVGVALATKKKDIFFGNHRSHGHYLAKDGNLEKMIFEVFGDTRGSCNGFGGSMHMIDQKVNFFASIPILGSIVQKGKLAASAFFEAVKALNKVDLPIFGSPTIPHLNPIKILIYLAWK